MNISYIEETIVRILKYNPSLSESSFRSLLVSSEWQNSDIKSAIILFKGIKGISVNEVVSNKSIDDIIISNELLRLDDEKVIRKNFEEKEINIEANIEFGNLEEVTLIDSFKKSIFLKHFSDNFSQEKLTNDINQRYLLQDAVKISNNNLLKAKDEILEISSHKEILYLTSNKKREEVKGILEKKSLPLPEDLPILPFHSAVYAMRLDQYVDSFIKDDKNRETKYDELKKEKEASPNDMMQRSLRDEDRELVKLALTMLLLIIILMGYMYSSGRL